MLKKKELLLSILLFSSLGIILFWQFFINGLSLFPGNYLQALFEPYKSINIQNGVVTIANKPVSDDVFRHIYPFKTLAVDMLKHFQLPLWNPYNGAGMPLLATVNSGLIDPFNLLFFIMPYLLAWNIYLLIQFILIGLFTYLYCRSIRLQILSSIMAAIVFVVSGFVVVRISFGAYGLAIAMLPFILFLFEKYFENSKTKLLYILPFTIFSFITSTHPQMSLYILLFSTIYLFVRVFTMQTQNKLKTVILPLIFIMLGLSLSAIQIFPTVELLHYSNLRSDTSSYIATFLLPFYQLISVAIPNYFGNTATYNYWGGGSDSLQTAAYVGLIPCFFALLGLTGNNKMTRSIKIIFLITIIATILIAIDSPLSRFIVSLPIPIFSTDPPSRIFFLTTFSIAILSGIGFDLLLIKKESFFDKIKSSIYFLICLLLLIAGTIYYYLQSDKSMNYTVALRNTIFESSFFIIGYLLFLGINKVKNNTARLLVVSAIIVLIFSSGFYDAEKFLPFSANETIFPETPLLSELTTLSKDGSRVFGFEFSTITTDFATYFRFYDPQYYHPLYIKRYGELLSFSNNGQYGYQIPRSDASIDNSLSISQDEKERRKRLLDLLGVDYFIYNIPQHPPKQITPVVWSDSIRYIKKNPGVLPHTFLVSDPMVITKNNDILHKLFSSDFDPTKQVVLEQDPHLSTTRITAKGNNTATIINYGENTVTIHANATKPSMLVLLDNYYPGWHATVDGRETPVYRANYTFRAIVLPEGNHQVVFTYQPLSVTIGSTITLISFFIIGALFFRGMFQKRQL